MRYGKITAVRLAVAASLAALTGCEQANAPSMQVEGNSALDYRWTAAGVRLQDGREAHTVDLPGWHWAGEPYGCGPTLTRGPKGEIVVTSDVLPTLWRIDPQTRAVTVHALELDADRDKDVGFSSISYSPRHGAYFAVSHGHGSLWRIDPLLRRAQKTALSGLGPKGCDANWAGLHVFPDQRAALMLPSR